MTLNVVNEQGRVVARAFDGDLGAGPQTLTWDGRKRIGKLLDGDYLASLVLQEPIGAVTHSRPFVADSAPPKLNVLSVRNLVVLRLGEDSLVTLYAGRRAYKRQAKAGTSGSG